ncbi:hypothetical protein ACIQ9P_03630 [Kitasatospora sp. NPDC094019]|uniref:hypothetical protein n=1 Tax=Kitasatospora sp. NPDC094019 TaxID=3364091 RepID=UPI00382DF53E
MSIDIEHSPSGSIGIIEVRGPEHHQLAVLDIITTTPLLGAEVASNAFGLVEHAISVAWGSRTDDYRALTFLQFHDLVRDRYYADLYRRAIDLRGNFGRIGDLAGDVALALVTDPQLNP